MITRRKFLKGAAAVTAATAAPVNASVGDLKTITKTAAKGGLSPEEISKLGYTCMSYYMGNEPVDYQARVSRKPEKKDDEI